jgi:hypothetical protein
MPDFFDYPDREKLLKKPLNARVNELFKVAEVQGYVSHEQVNYYVPDAAPDEKLRLQTLFRNWTLSDEEILSEVHNTLWYLMGYTNSNGYVQPEGDDKNTPEDLAKAMYNFITREKEKQTLELEYEKK